MFAWVARLASKPIFFANPTSNLLFESVCGVVIEQKHARLNHTFMVTGQRRDLRLYDLSVTSDA